MALNLKHRGIVSPTLLLLFFFLFAAAIFFGGFRRYIFATYQDIGYKLGAGVNNISTTQYVNWIKSQQGYNQSASQATFLNSNVKIDQTAFKNTTEVLGESVDDNKWIEISLSQQRLFLKDHGNTVASFLVSTGKWAPTPTGEWRIWTKLRYVRMTGGSQALGTYYDLPNVPFTMFFYQGFGIHGTYWHNNFGHPMSHGCVNMKTAEAEYVYNWASVGTRVKIYQ